MSIYNKLGKQHTRHKGPVNDSEGVIEQVLLTKYLYGLALSILPQHEVCENRKQLPVILTYF